MTVKHTCRWCSSPDLPQKALHALSGHVEAGHGGEDVAEEAHTRRRAADSFSLAQLEKGLQTGFTWPRHWKQRKERVSGWWIAGDEVAAATARMMPTAAAGHSAHQSGQLAVVGGGEGGQAGGGQPEGAINGR